MAAIGVLGIGTGFIHYNVEGGETVTAGQLNPALPTMASKSFKANKYDNAAGLEDDAGDGGVFAALSLEEKNAAAKQEEKVRDGGFGTNEGLDISRSSEKTWESREQISAHYSKTLGQQQEENNQRIAQLTKPAALSAAELAERKRRDEALERAARLEFAAADQLEGLQQQPAYPHSSTAGSGAWDPYAGSGIKPVAVTLPNVEDYIDFESRERPQNAFYELKGARKAPQMLTSKPVPNAIEAVVHGDAGEVLVTNGSTVKLRLLQDIQVGEHLLPKHSLLSGSCSISGERVHILLTAVRIQSSIIPIQLRVFDLDGHAGIYVPDMAIKHQLAQTGSQAVTGGSLQMPYMIPQGGRVGEMVVAQTAAQGVNMVANGVRAIASKKISQQKASIKPNYKVYLKQD
jgi:conjugative transposon TraM protein